MDLDVTGGSRIAALNESERRAVSPTVAVWSIMQVAAHFRVTQRALRFYESRELIVSHRAGGIRCYDAIARDRLAVIVRAKALGFTLAEIRLLLESSEQSGEAEALPLSRAQCVEQINLLERQKRQIEAALAELRRTYTGIYRANLALTDAAPE